MADELDNLAGLAAAADMGAAALDPVDPNVQAEPEAPAAPDYMTEAQGTVAMFAALVVGYCPKAEPLWGPDVQGRIASALAPVMEKYGFSLGGMPPELTLVIVAGPVLYQSSKLVAAQMAAERVKVAKPSAVEMAATGQADAMKMPQEKPETNEAPQMALYRK
jgi:hypothetical protein